MFFFRQKKADVAPTFNPHDTIPNHIAIIMDGNGRWAQAKLLPRIAGHKEGMQTVKKIALHAKALGVKVLSLYAFSTENWKRPNDEVSFLMKLPIDFFGTFIPQLQENNIRVMTTGMIDDLPEHTKKAVQDAVFQTRHNDGMILNFALNYGSRLEIVEAIKEIVMAFEGRSEQITQEVVSQHLWSKHLGEYADPDLLIRTSGEQRISNFMLWQIAYSECYFTEECWPDFTEGSLEKAISTYQKRHRRYGGL